MSEDEKIEQPKRPETAEEMLEILEDLQKSIGGGLEDMWREDHEQEKAREKAKDEDRG